MKDKGILYILEPEITSPNFISIVPDPRKPEPRGKERFTTMMYQKMYLIFRLITCIKLLNTINKFRKKIFLLCCKYEYNFTSILFYKLCKYMYFLRKLLFQQSFR